MFPRWTDTFPRWPEREKPEGNKVFLLFHLRWGTTKMHQTLDAFFILKSSLLISYRSKVIEIPCIWQLAFIQSIFTLVETEHQLLYTNEKNPRSAKRKAPFPAGVSGSIFSRCAGEPSHSRGECRKLHRNRAIPNFYRSARTNSAMAAIQNLRIKSIAARDGGLAHQNPSYSGLRERYAQLWSPHPLTLRNDRTPLRKEWAEAHYLCFFPTDACLDEPLFQHLVLYLGGL